MHAATQSKDRKRDGATARVASALIAPALIAFAIAALPAARLRADAVSVPIPAAVGAPQSQGAPAAALFDFAGRACPLPSGTLSLNAAIELALCRNLRTRSTWAARQQAASPGGPESEGLPLETTVDESQNSEARVDIIESGAPGNRVADGSASSTPDAAIHLSWALYDVGGAARSLRHREGAAVATLSTTSQQMIFSVVQDYYAVIAADDELLAAQASGESGQRSVDAARALQGGGASLTDVLQAESARDQAVLARVKAYLADKSARDRLAVDIGAPADQILVLETEPVPAQPPVFAARMAELMGQAVRQRADLAAALTQREASEKTGTGVPAGGRPAIDLQTGRSVGDARGTASPNANQVGLYEAVPIFKAFNTRYTERRTQAALGQTRASADRLGACLDVWNAYYALNSATHELAARAALINTAEDHQQLAWARYQAGGAAIQGVFKAQSGASSARLMRIDAERAWRLARAQLAFALERLSGMLPLAEEAPLSASRQEAR